MIHRASPFFWEAYNALPNHVRQLADEKFDLLKPNPNHPSLKLKKVNQYWSVRIGLKHRALGVDIPDGILWFWIGSHDKYDQIVS